MKQIFKDKNYRTKDVLEISFWAFICGISIGAMIGILYMLFWGAP